MAIAVDVIILAILGVCIFFGYKRGLIGVAFKILSFLVAILITILLYKPVANYIIDHTQIDENLEQTIHQKVAGNIEDQKTENKIEEANTSDIITNYINNIVEQTADTAKENIAEAVSRNLAITIINGGVMVILFIGLQILLLFAKAISEMLSELPIIKQFNTTGGILYGILEGLFFVYLILMIISLIAPMLNQIGILQAINHSSLGSILYNNNILLKILF